MEAYRWIWSGSVLKRSVCSDNSFTSHIPICDLEAVICWDRCRIIPGREHFLLTAKLVQHSRRSSTILSIISCGIHFIQRQKSNVPLGMLGLQLRGMTFEGQTSICYRQGAHSGLLKEVECFSPKMTAVACREQLLGACATTMHATEQLDSPSFGLARLCEYWASALPGPSLSPSWSRMHFFFQRPMMKRAAASLSFKNLKIGRYISPS